MRTFDRRSFLHTSAALSLAGAGLGMLRQPAAAGAETRVSGSPKRKFTMDFSCGMIGVKAAPREAIRLAHQYGFESYGMGRGSRPSTAA